MQQSEAKTRPVRWWILAAAAVVVVAALVAVLITVTGKGETAVANPPAPVTSSSQAATAPPADPGQTPAEIVLPGGGTAKLVPEDVAGDGSLPIPQSLGEAAWWGAKLGAKQGAALLSGHVNWKGKTGPFKELWNDKDGQEVKLTDAAGGKWVYRIDAVVTVDKADLAGKAEQLFSPDGPHRLVLVTCGGEYVGGTEGYDENRIVTASLVSRP